MKRRVFITVIAALTLAACGGSQPPAINVYSIKTILNEDGGGSSEFQLVAPKTCKVVPSLPERLKDQHSQPDAITEFDDGKDYGGFLVTYKFDSSYQIPGQIQSLKSAIEQARHPTSAPMQLTPGLSPTTISSTPIPMPTSVPYDPNQLSIDFNPSINGKEKEWDVTVKIDPMLWTSPSPCGIPRITYELTMPGVIISSGAEAALFRDYSREYSHVESDKGTSKLRWTIELKSIEAIVQKEILQHQEAAVDKLRQELRQQVRETAVAASSDSTAIPEEVIEFVAISKYLQSDAYRSELNREIDEESDRLKEDKEVQARKFVELAKSRKTDADRQKLAEFLKLNTPVYTLTVKSTIQESLTETAKQISDLISVVIGVVVGVITTIIAILTYRSSKRHKSTP